MTDTQSNTDPYVSYREFNFKEYKQLLCTAYQTADFKDAMYLGKEDYSETFDDPLPYPIQEYPVEYELFCRLLEKSIEEQDLLAMELISKTEAKTQYKINDRFFELFYPCPEQVVELSNARERFGKSQMHAHLYNRNKIIQILESSEYQDHLEFKKNRKATFLNRN